MDCCAPPVWWGEGIKQCGDPSVCLSVRPIRSVAARYAGVEVPSVVVARYLVFTVHRIQNAPKAVA